MKALKRNPGETVTEASDIEGIDWTTGAPLTNAAWCGGPYTLVQNYVAPKEGAPAEYDVMETLTETEEETVTIDGVTYTKSQLRALLGE